MYVHKATPFKVAGDDLGFNYDWAVTNNVSQQQAFIKKALSLTYPFLVKTDNTYVLVSGYWKYIEVHYTKIFDFLGIDTHTEAIEMFEDMSIAGVIELFGEIHAEPSAPQDSPNTWFDHPSPVNIIKSTKNLLNDPLASLLKDLEASASKPKYSWTVGKHGVSFKQQTIKDEVAF